MTHDIHRLNTAIYGASGFLGHNLVHHLLDTTNWNVRAVATHLRDFHIPTNQQDRFEAMVGDVQKDESVRPTLENIDIAYYFVHLMGHKGVDFYTGEIAAAETFGRAAKAAGVKRIIFMGGLGRDNDTLSRHLEARHRSGDKLRASGVPVVEFRASMIIGRGSVAFDIITTLVQKLPFMVLPGVAKTLTQPIALSDALEYLTLAANYAMKQKDIIEIGGPEVLSYEALYRAYLVWSPHHRLFVRIPFLPSRLGGIGLDLFTPTVHARIGKVMVDSMVNEMIVTNENAYRIFPSVKPMGLYEAFEATKLQM